MNQMSMSNLPRDAAEATGASEQALVERLRAGDEGVFDALVATVGPRLLAVARTMLRDEQDAQDAVQDAFLSAFRTLGDFDGRSLLSTWLHRITVNCCLMKLRSRRRRPAMSIEELLPTFLPDGHQTQRNQFWNPIPSSGIERRELLDQVRAHIAHLPDQSREVIMLRDVLGLSTEETAHMLEISPPAVKTRLSRARQALRSLVEHSVASITTTRSGDTPA